MRPIQDIKPDPDEPSSSSSTATTTTTGDNMAALVAAQPSAPHSLAAANKRGGGGGAYRPTPAKTFQCRGFGDCRMVFSRSEHLARHIRKHTGERPFSCHCSKQFSRLDNLRQHAQTVHADKADENEAMMRDLTTLHATMVASHKTGRRRGAGSGKERPGTATGYEGQYPGNPSPGSPYPPTSPSYDGSPIDARNRHSFAAPPRSAASTSASPTHATFLSAHNGSTNYHDASPSAQPNSFLGSHPNHQPTPPLGVRRTSPFSAQSPPPTSTSPFAPPSPFQMDPQAHPFGHQERTASPFDRSPFSPFAAPFETNPQQAPTDFAPQPPQGQNQAFGPSPSSHHPQPHPIITQIPWDPLGTTAAPHQQQQQGPFVLSQPPRRQSHRQQPQQEAPASPPHHQQSPSPTGGTSPSRGGGLVQPGQASTNNTTTAAAGSPKRGSMSPHSGSQSPTQAPPGQRQQVGSADPNNSRLFHQSSHIQRSHPGLPQRQEIPQPQAQTLRWANQHPTSSGVAPTGPRGQEQQLAWQGQLNNGYYPYPHQGVGQGQHQEQPQRTTGLTAQPSALEALQLGVGVGLGISADPASNGEWPAGQVMEVDMDLSALGDLAGAGEMYAWMDRPQGEDTSIPPQQQQQQRGETSTWMMNRRSASMLGAEAGISRPKTSSPRPPVEPHQGILGNERLPTSMMFDHQGAPQGTAQSLNDGDRRGSTVAGQWGMGNGTGFQEGQDRQPRLDLDSPTSPSEKEEAKYRQELHRQQLLQLWHAQERARGGPPGIQNNNGHMHLQQQMQQLHMVQQQQQQARVHTPRHPSPQQQQPQGQGDQALWSVDGNLELRDPYHLQPPSLHHQAAPQHQQQAQPWGQDFVF